jgi:glycosyltransferase involved in cell wall biosynthesis
MDVIIISPSLDTTINVSGISSVTQFIIDNNPRHKYVPFEVGKRDNEVRDLTWLLKIFRSYFQWFKILISRNKEIIHFNLAFSKRSLIRDTPLILLSKLFRKRMIIHTHGGELLTNDNPPSWVTISLKCILKGRNPKIVQSSIEAEVLKRKFSCEKISILPNCVETKTAKEFIRQTSTRDKLILLFLSRISVDKGLEFIFRALKILKEQGVSYKFIMAGTGPDEKEYVQKFEDLLKEDFKFMGVVYGDQKIELFKTSDVYLLPSFYEGLPMALLETMSYGLVPLTTNVGSIGTVVRNMDNGIIVKVRSTEDIVNAIKLLSTNRETLNDLGENAREYIYKNYNPENYIASLNELYNYK